MSEIGLPAYPLRPTAKPVLISMGISLAVHGLLFGLVVVLGVAAAAFKDSNPKVLERLAEMQRAQPKPDNPARHEAEIPMLFIEVDPTTATPGRRRPTPSIIPTRAPRRPIRMRTLTPAFPRSPGCRPTSPRPKPSR